MTDTIKISRDELQRIAQGCSCEVTTDALDALLATPPADAADIGGQAGEEVEVVAWRIEHPAKQWKVYEQRQDWAYQEYGHIKYEVQDLMTVAQHERIVAALSVQQSAQPEFCCKHSYKVAKQAAWDARDLTHCKCDHNEYCEHCWPDDFKEGGKWYNGFEAQQSEPERVSVPVELAERLVARKTGESVDDEYAARAELRALLASHGRGEA